MGKNRKKAKLMLIFIESHLVVMISMIFHHSVPPKSLAAYFCTNILHQNISNLTLCTKDLPEIFPQIHPGEEGSLLNLCIY